jgi:hypothetical protein
VFNILCLATEGLISCELPRPGKTQNIHKRTREKSGFKNLGLSGRLRQKDLELKASLSCIVSPCFKGRKKKKTSGSSKTSPTTCQN